MGGARSYAIYILGCTLKHDRRPWLEQQSYETKMMTVRHPDVLSPHSVCKRRAALHTAGVGARALVHQVVDASSHPAAVVLAMSVPLTSNLDLASCLIIPGFDDTSFGCRVHNHHAYTSQVTAGTISFRGGSVCHLVNVCHARCAPWPKDACDVLQGVVREPRLLLQVAQVEGTGHLAVERVAHASWLVVKHVAGRPVQDGPRICCGCKMSTSRLSTSRHWPSHTEGWHAGYWYYHYH